LGLYWDFPRYFNDDWIHRTNECFVGELTNKYIVNPQKDIETKMLRIWVAFQ
jgi:hypothetical protein